MKKYTVYSPTLPVPTHSFQVVGVADPRKFACKKLQEQHNIAEENIFEG